MPTGMTCNGARDLLDDALSANLPYVTVPAGRELGDIAIAVRMWPQGEHALRLALAAAGDLTGLRPLRPDKQRARSGVQGIGALAALCAARAGDAAMAALHLEQASATLLAEALGVRADTITSADITTACRAMGRSVPSPLRHRRTDPLTAECPACWSGPTPGRMTGPSPASRRGAPGRRPVPGGTDPAARPAVSRTGPVARVRLRVRAKRMIRQSPPRRRARRPTQSACSAKPTSSTSPATAMLTPGSRIRRCCR